MYTKVVIRLTTSQLLVANWINNRAVKNLSIIMLYVGTFGRSRSMQTLGVHADFTWVLAIHGNKDLAWVFIRLVNPVKLPLA